MALQNLKKISYNIFIAMASSIITKVQANQASFHKDLGSLSSKFQAIISNLVNNLKNISSSATAER